MVFCRLRIVTIVAMWCAAYYGYCGIGCHTRSESASSDGGCHLPKTLFPNKGKNMENAITLPIDNYVMDTYPQMTMILSENFGISLLTLEKIPVTYGFKCVDNAI